MVTSDLVYSPAQVTEHRHMELKDQNISEETKKKFEELKKKYPKVFSLNNGDIGHTQLVTMDIDMGDTPPVCKKPDTLPLKHYNKKLKHWNVLVLSERALAHGQALLL